MLFLQKVNKLNDIFAKILWIYYHIIEKTTNELIRQKTVVMIVAPLIITCMYFMEINYML